jgi:hypothetical protein
LFAISCLTALTLLLLLLLLLLLPPLLSCSNCIVIEAVVAGGGSRNSGNIWAGINHLNTSGYFNTTGFDIFKKIYVLSTGFIYKFV